MDQRVKQIMEKSMEANSNSFQEIEPLTNKKMGQILDYCFTRNQNNSDRFADCIIEKNKKVEDLMKSIEFKILFYTKFANSCLASNKSQKQCEEQTKTEISRMLSNLKSEVNKL